MAEDATRTSSEELFRIGIAGQQHGIVMWNSEALQRGVLDCSELYNWMYPGDEKAAAKLPKSSSNCVFPGYGMRTLCELASYPDFDKAHHWDRCGNIMDYLACYLTGTDEVQMSESNAYCWGYSTGLHWNEEILPFTPKWIQLPEIVSTDAGTFTKLGDCRLKALNGLQVGVAIADLHGCIMSVRGLYDGADHACESDYPKSLVPVDYGVYGQSLAIPDLVLGTSSQLCFVMSNAVKLPKMPITTHIFPFTKDLILVAAASMNGGNALDAFLKSIRQWSEEMTETKTPNVDMSRILMEVDRGYLSQIHFTVSSQMEQGSGKDFPKVKAVFTAERGSPDTGAEICGLKSNTSLTEMLIGVCEGVVHNLFSLVPSELLTSFGVRKLFLCGNAKQSRFLVHIRRYLQEQGAELELVLAETDTSAAYGVAL
ncbi:unnamed protein product [Nippostrongylus brasiliensis]|uniref:FGGY_N domain-containing protein n=1 Tax=Nippostrongylus brasiliensis TaxID=27835 RepID=A0A0N4YHN5_NIPBR|nr:unnamed protein product [Nippostrongylus brasiliensis]